MATTHVTSDYVTYGIAYDLAGDDADLVIDAGVQVT